MATFEHDVTIDASVESVWSMLLKAQSWTTWFPDVDQISGLESVEPGSTFRWQHGEEQGTGRIEEVDHSRGLIKVITTKDGHNTTHTFDLDQAGGFFGIGANDTKLKYRREYKAEGSILGEFIVGGNPFDSREVKQTVEKIKRLIQG